MDESMWNNDYPIHIREIRVHYVSASSVRFVAKGELLQLKSGSGPIWCINIRQKGFCASALSGVTGTLMRSITTGNQGRRNFLGGTQRTLSATFNSITVIWEAEQKPLGSHSRREKSLLPESKSIFNKRDRWISLRYRSLCITYSSSGIRTWMSTRRVSRYLIGRSFISFIYIYLPAVSVVQNVIGRKNVVCIQLPKERN